MLPGRVRIFDTFPFDAELDLLEHRLRETYELVDAFVLVEAAETYAGQPKELTFASARERFSWAASKLRHVTLQSLGPVNNTPRRRAAIQRDAVRLGLRDASPDDVVLLLDVDEIPSRSLLQKLRAEGIDQPRRILMTRHYQHVDALAPRSPCCPSDDVAFPTATRHLYPDTWDTLDLRWYSQSGVATPFSVLMNRNAFDVRFQLIDATPLQHGGRHFSSVDTSARLERKLHRVFHTEWSGARETAPAHLMRCRANGVHHRGWWYAERPKGALPEDIVRLRDRLGISAEAQFPSTFRRRAVRTWAWMRLARWLPERVVATVDRSFDRLLPFTAPVLLAADRLRSMRAALAHATITWKRQEHRRR